MTCSWKILVECKYISIDWFPLKNIKQYNPVELTEYAVANGISDETAFRWWVKENLRRQDMIIYKIK